MERIKTLLARYSQTAFIFFMGLILIIYLSMGILYLQQAPQQRKFQEQIVSLNAILKNPLPDKNILKRDIDAIDLTLTPIADNVTIAMLVSLAEKIGIDVKEENGKFRVPIAARGSSGSYQIVHFSGIHVQGDYNKVMTFIRTLDSDEKLETVESSTPRIVVRVVTMVVLEEVEVTATGQDAERRTEFRKIIDAVKAMMTDNARFIIPNPMSSNSGKATEYMGDNPETPVFEGFPDNTTPYDEPRPAGKGYTGNATPKKGYLLYEHDKISDNTTLYTTVDYFPTLRTAYYYTAEADGTVRQWSGSNVAIAEEYPDSKPTKIELKASVDVDIYFKQK